MSISNISSSASQFSDVQASFKSLKNDFDSLESALKSGDLKSAKTAYDKIKQDKATLDKNAPAGAKGKSGDLDQAFDELGKALDSGDTKAAQSALTKLQSHRHPKPPQGFESGSAGPDDTGAGGIVNVSA